MKNFKIGDLVEIDPDAKESDGRAARNQNTADHRLRKTLGSPPYRISSITEIDLGFPGISRTLWIENGQKRETIRDVRMRLVTQNAEEKNRLYLERRHKR